ncbi:MAG: hypothetical protein E7625_06780 [Ruminococcaceae bacterium]|nr:hypothetical protein [Oscillospiraceae bacterium]
MKKSYKIAVTILLVSMMLFSGFAFGTVSASALLPDDCEPGPIVYYLFDYYPVLPNSQASALYPGHNFVYDHRPMEATTLLSIITDPSLDDLSGQCFVLDAKLSLPNEFLLETLFEALQSIGCKTIFVTTFDLTDMANEDFMDYVDYSYQSTFGSLRSFAKNSILKVVDLYEERNNVTASIQNTAILIDKKLIDATDIDGDDITSLCEDSPFLLYLLEQLYAGTRTDQEHFSIEGVDPNDVLSALHEVHGIDIFVYAGNDQYVCLYTGQSFYSSDITSFPCIQGLAREKCLAIGFSSISSDFRGKLIDWYEQNDQSTLPMYTLEADPIIFSEDGLPTHTDTMLGQEYDWSWNEPEEFLEFLINAIGAPTGGLNNET